ncbi:unnamed protein product [Enterobius vermicularis]|uniref:Collagen triple helix repeat protein n=1 Tax=Enterobius vermicularis TaxID=51028 RepID=A0A0N4VMI5_ENTVE|nr:unnamed protein product [Enterobius vermicularis]
MAGHSGPPGPAGPPGKPGAPANLVPSYCGICPPRASASAALAYEKNNGEMSGIHQTEIITSKTTYTTGSAEGSFLGGSGVYSGNNVGAAFSSAESADSASSHSLGYHNGAVIVGGTRSETAGHQLANGVESSYGKTVVNEASNEDHEKKKKKRKKHHRRKRLKKSRKVL